MQYKHIVKFSICDKINVTQGNISFVLYLFNYKRSDYMPIPLIPEDEKIINFLKTYGQVKKSSLEALFNPQRINKLVRKGLISEECNFVKMNNMYEPPQSNMHYAVELLEHLKDKVSYYDLNQHPYLMFFIMNEIPYDITVIEPGTEAIYLNLIDRTAAENVIAIIADPKQAEKLHSEKIKYFCTLEPFKMYKVKE